MSSSPSVQVVDLEAIIDIEGLGVVDKKNTSREMAILFNGNGLMHDFAPDNDDAERDT